MEIIITLVVTKRRAASRRRMALEAAIVEQLEMSSLKSAKKEKTEMICSRSRDVV